MRFTIQADQFILDNKTFRILSGAMHYFRIVPEYWRDRLEKLRWLGLNTLETYVAWNMHEPQPGQFIYENGLDLTRYIQMAGDLGFKVIVRPGPYICSEWDFGGLPAWLLQDSNMRLRCSYPPYLAAVDRFFGDLLPRLAPLQIDKGGPIIAMQIENEYGSYGNDASYIEHLVSSMRKLGIDVPFFTSDGPGDGMLQGGGLPGLLKTVNFAVHPERALETLRRYQPHGPLMVTEFWDGWFDHWGEAHNHAYPYDPSAENSAPQVLERILASGASVNLYMAHGGTNFGFMNGANFDVSGYSPTVTSYDYDAPISEAGDLTPKFYALRQVFGRYAPLPELPEPASTPKQSLGTFAMQEMVSLFDALPVLSKPIEMASPLPVEPLGGDYGFILYRTRVSGPRPEGSLRIFGLHDRAQVFANRQPLGVIEREDALYVSFLPELRLAVAEDGVALDILVENLGRVNFGPGLLERKGISDGVALDLQYLFGWQMYLLPLDNLSNLQFTQFAPANGPVFYRLHFQVKEQHDTFLSLAGWTKGACWLNGFNLGRYWEIGPQKTLYIPGPLLKTGLNELVIFELHPNETTQIEFINHPEIG